MCAEEATGLFFQVIGLSVGVSNRPSRQLRGRSGSIARGGDACHGDAAVNDRLRDRGAGCRR
jgi:hypothetical protein